MGVKLGLSLLLD